MGRFVFVLLLLACSLFIPQGHARLDPSAFQINPATFSQKDLLPTDFWEKSLPGQVKAWQQLANIPKPDFPEAINFGLYLAEHLKKYLAQSPWRGEITSTIVYLPDVEGLGIALLPSLAKRSQQYLREHHLPEYPGLPGYVTKKTLRHPLLAHRPIMSALLILQLRPRGGKTPSVLAQYITYLEEQFLQIDPLIFDPVGNLLHQSTAYFRNDLTGARPYLGLGIEVLSDLLNAHNFQELKNNIPLHHELLHWQSYAQAAHQHYGPFTGILHSEDGHAMQVLGKQSRDFGLLLPLDEIFAYWHSIQDALEELARLIGQKPIDWDKIQYLVFSTNQTLEALAYHLTAGIRLSNYAYHHFARYHGKSYPLEKYQLTSIPITHTFTVQGKKQRLNYDFLLPQSLAKNEEAYLKFQQAYLVPLTKKFTKLKQAWEGEVERIQNLYQREFQSMMEEEENILNPAYSGHPLSSPSFYQQCAHLLKKAAAQNSLPPAPVFNPQANYPRPPAMKDLGPNIIP